MRSCRAVNCWPYRRNDSRDTAGSVHTVTFDADDLDSTG